MKCLYRVNCGATEPYVDSAGETWLADQEWAPGKSWGAIGGHAVYRDAAIPPSDAVRPGLYRAERFAMQGYDFHVPDATYEVRLHFAETFESFYRAGFRAFHVAINGLRVLHEFDPYSAAGGFAKPVIKTFHNVGAPGGKLSIQFFEGSEINAIEIHRVSDAPAPKRERKRILFVGNSHAIFWATSLTIEHFVNVTPNAIHLEVHRALIGGKTLVFHYDQTDVKKKIEEGKFDYVVVQGLRMDNPDHSQQLKKYVPLYAELIRKNGGTPLLYCTWPFKDSPKEEFDKVIEPNLAAARESGMVFVPACPAWKEALIRRPDIQLFNTSDNVHAGLWGAYLTACVFYGVLTGKSPVDVVPASVIIGQVNVDPATARFLQQVAWDTVGKYRNGGR